jgi:hypothetical protein
LGWKIVFRPYSASVMAIPCVIQPENTGSMRNGCGISMVIVILLR